MRAAPLVFSLVAAAATALAVASCGSTTTCLIATCGGQCVDTTQDPQNCGQCATQCSACANSHCSVTVATTPAPVSILTTDGVDLYLAAPSTGLLGTGFDVLRVPAAGGALAKLASSSTGQIEGIASDGHSVYYTTLGTPGVTPGPDAVMQVPVAGGTPVTLASSADTGAPVDGPGDVLVSGGNLYWTNGKSCAAACTPSIVTVPSAGGQPTTLQGLFASATGFDSPLAVAGSDLYFGAHGASGGSTLYKVASSGVGPVSSIQSVGVTIDAAYGSKAPGAVLTALAVAGDEAYWGSTGSDVWNPGAATTPGGYPGTRFTTPEDTTTGDGPTVGSVTGIAFDTTDVYWLYAPNAVQYQVWSAPRAGGASVLLAQATVSATHFRPTSTGLASVGSFVYWSDGTTVYRTQK